MEITSTPIHDSTLAVVRGWLPRDTVRPPRHPDIYAELCARLGHHREDEIRLPEQRRGDDAGPSGEPPGNRGSVDGTRGSS